MLRKICGLFLIFTMMLGLSTSVFAASERIQENQKDVDKYVQEYKGVKYDIRMNSAPNEIYESLRTSEVLADTPVDMEAELYFNGNNIENQKDVDKYVQEYKGVKYDIRMNSAPKGFLNSIDLKTDESVELNTNDEKDLITNNEVNMMRSGMPTGGGEYSYRPSYWNDPQNIYRANCYGYVLNRISSNKSDPHAGYIFQPGYRKGKLYTAYTQRAIIKAVKSDMESLGRTIRSSSYSEKPKSNEYKIALVIANDDYHWYRQDRDGGWSHKPGLTGITYKDASGNYISDPKTCDRNYYYANYSTWGGYYIISR